MTDKPLAGKTALVTGGSRGIGAATAIRLARDGADVAISYRSSADRAGDVVKAIEQLGVRGQAFATDQADTEQATRLVSSVVESFGRLDILVNNAAVFVTGTVDAEDVDMETFNLQLATNVQGVAATTRAAVRVMGEGSRIVSVSTSGADRAPFPGIGDYSATKARRARGGDLVPRRPGRDLRDGATLNVDGGFNA
jgi:3-oxoacyl-[acyl-carrier protein] reductase